jgi:hypothetical protein
MMDNGDTDAGGVGHIYRVYEWRGVRGETETNDCIAV